MIDEKKFMEFMTALEDAGAEHVSFDDLRKFVDEFPKIGGWIPCSERLPTKEESIKNDNRFILDDGNRRYGGLFDYEKQCFVQFDFWKGLVEDKCAIAWQPLPEEYHG